MVDILPKISSQTRTIFVKKFFFLKNHVPIRKRFWKAKNVAVVLNGLKKYR